jgi:hypothetical protein
MEKVGIGSEFLYPFFFLSRYLVRSEYFSVIVVVLRILREKNKNGEPGPSVSSAVSPDHETGSRLFWPWTLMCHPFY